MDNSTSIAASSPFEQERDQIDATLGSFRSKRYHSLRKELRAVKKSKASASTSPSSNHHHHSHHQHYHENSFKRQSTANSTYLEWRRFLLEQKGQTFASAQSNPSMKLTPQDMLMVFDAKKQQDQMKPPQFLFLSGGSTNIPKSSSASHRRSQSNRLSEHDSCASYQLDSQLDSSQIMSGHEDSISDENVEDYETNSPSVPRTKMSEVYEFVGMHHIFELGNGYDGIEVTVIKFANDNRDLLAFAANDGTLAIATAWKTPEIIHRLKGHKDAILDFDWSLSNEYILTVSKDATIRIWNTSNGKCIRVIDKQGACRAVKFFPLNPNFFCVGFEGGIVGLYNLSTGKLVEKLKINKLSVGMGSFVNINMSLGSNNHVTCLTFSTLGNRIFIGDVMGYLWIYDFDASKIAFGKLLQKTKVSLNGKSISSIDYQMWTGNSSKASPRILVSAMDSYVHLYQYSQTAGQFIESIRFPVSQKNHPVRSHFCPLVPYMASSCFVTGSESTEILFYSTKFGSSHAINRLMGHSSPVLDVSWSYDETLLASCDSSGVVILWKRRPLEDKDA